MDRRVRMGTAICSGLCCVSRPDLAFICGLRPGVRPEPGADARQRRRLVSKLPGALDRNRDVNFRTDIAQNVQNALAAAEIIVRG